MHNRSHTSPSPAQSRNSFCPQRYFLGRSSECCPPCRLQRKPWGGWRLGLWPPSSRQGSGTGWEMDGSGWKPSFLRGPSRTPCLALEPLYATLMCDPTHERVAWQKAHCCWEPQPSLPVGEPAIAGKSVSRKWLLQGRRWPCGLPRFPGLQGQRPGMDS